MIAGINERKIRVICITSMKGGYNMKNTIITLGLAGLIFGGLFIAPKITNAYRGDINVKGPNYTEERHAAMEKAFDNKDYNTWKNLMTGRGRVTQVINKDNFAKFAQIHELLEQGKTSEANKIKAELGLGLQNGTGYGAGMGRNRSK
ncbi:MAG: hypothetical protein UR68_C0019G0007 [Candidatus Roizmanbacteria bacterium GW2011_GWA2_35_19]|uniref:Uncharacterized protein n=2 Tax=Candidatus Roizmaniibacteriota TaxID=1752723 RepID=A0A0G0EYI7_9BACT|nr:MAG: hypothetical protein UR63_C0048G0002 [Candidatus Roizmanbacteria bacterium GW2011_GWC2_35_12]KKP72237.1 MAG: hypothetical protein UR68_C0019G0007 [Candidatus Roizmanbacteria bacterium GW2011_GWA2_35_19]